MSNKIEVHFTREAIEGKVLPILKSIAQKYSAEMQDVGNEHGYKNPHFPEYCIYSLHRTTQKVEKGILFKRSEVVAHDEKSKMILVKFCFSTCYVWDAVVFSYTSEFDADALDIAKQIQPYLPVTLYINAFSEETKNIVTQNPITIKIDERIKGMVESMEE